MPVTRIDRNQTFRAGQLVHEEVVETDITREAVEYDLHARARAALDANAAFLALESPTNAQRLAHERRLTRECSALIRLLIGSDLLDSNEGT